MTLKLAIEEHGQELANRDARFQGVQLAYEGVMQQKFLLEQRIAETGDGGSVVQAFGKLKEQYDELARRYTDLDRKYLTDMAAVKQTAANTEQQLNGQVHSLNLELATLNKDKSILEAKLAANGDLIKAKEAEIEHMMKFFSKP